MKKKSYKILSIVLALAIMLGTSVALVLTSSAAGDIKLYYADYPRGNDPVYGDSAWSYGDLVFMNGWHAEKPKNPCFQLISKDSYNGQVVYCLEPGVLIKASNESVQYNSTMDSDAFWSQAYSPSHSNGLSPKSARAFIGQILANGYQGKLNTNWTIASNGNQMMEAYATQILVWEVICGERDADFNHVSQSGYNVQLDRVASLPTKNLLMQYYNGIVSKVKGVANLPSFAAEKPEDAPTYLMDYEDGVYSIMLEDTNGNISSNLRIESADVAGLTFVKDGNKLNITCEEEFEGVTLVHLYDSISVADPTIISDGLHGTDQGGGNAQDGAFLPAHDDGTPLPPEEIPSKLIEVEGYFNLEFPHVHRYVPFETEPTCIQRGYTKWICRCGDSYVLNYTEPLGHEFCFASANAATCTENGVEVYRCHRCGATEVNAIPATGHGTPVYVTTIAPACTKEGEKVGYCDVCGMAIASEPIPATGHGETVLKIDVEPTADHEGQATPYCTVCGQAVGASVTLAPHAHEAGVEKVLKEATCTAAGEKGTFCKICNACYDVQPIEALDHDPIAVTTIPATCTFDGESSSFCSRCGTLVGSDVIPASGHQAGAWRVSTLATCTTDGREVCTCAVCGEICDSRVISASGHDSGAWMTKVPATCTTDGEEVQICTRCNAVTVTRVISAPGHDSGVWTQTVAATCIADGEKVCTCTRCGQVIDSEKIAATGHDAGVWMIDYEATPDHDGQMSLYCTICRQVLDTKSFEPHPHVEGYTVQLLAPTCTTEGEGGVVCDICGAVYRTYTIAALGHDYGAWSTNNNGTHKKTCSRCHDLQTENCKYTVVVLEPTCEEGGYTTHTCDVCGYTYTDDFKDPLGHDFSAWVDEEDGETHSRICARCGLKEYEGHEWGDWTYDRNAGLFRNGTKTRECAVCHALQTEKAHHTSWICRVFYPFALFISNLLVKLGYTASLNWLFPWLNVPPTM